MYVKRNIEARSCKYCCSGKALSISQSECICSLRCPACTAHAPYCHLWPVPLLQYFSTLSHKWNDFRLKKVFEHKMCVLSFSTTFVWNISHAKNQYDKKIHISVFIKGRLFFPISVKLEFYRRLFEKYSDIKFHEKPSSGSRVVPCGQTDRHDAANSRFSQFCECTWKTVRTA